MFGKLGDLSNLLQKAQQMQEEMKKVQEEISKLESKATSTGGHVEAIVTGDFFLKNLHISKSLLGADDPEIIQEQVLQAVNSAMNDVKLKAKEKMSSVTKGLNIPGLPF